MRQVHIGLVGRKGSGKSTADIDIIAAQSAIINDGTIGDLEARVYEVLQGIDRTCSWSMK